MNKGLAFYFVCIVSFSALAKHDASNNQTASAHTIEQISNPINQQTPYITSFIKDNALYTLQIKHNFYDDNHYFLCTLSTNSIVIGDMTLECIPSNGVSRIQTLHLCPEFRRKGLGSLLVNYAISLSHLLNNTNLYVHAVEDSDTLSLNELVQFYSCCGFTVQENLEDEIILTRAV